jgi:hypothetical protein
MMPNDARQIQNGLASINRMLNRLKYRFVSASDAQGPDFVRLRGNVNVAGGFPNGIHGLGERH